MYNNHPLKSRIVAAFTIQTLFMAVIAYTTIVSYVDYIEETLLYDHFTAYLDAYVNELDSGRSHIVPDDIKIYINGVNEIPSFVSMHNSGEHEIILPNGQAYHIIRKFYDGIEFILVKDQTDFESSEIKINQLTLLVLILFVITSFLFSRSVARRIVEPVIELAKKVKSLTTENYKDIKIDYADDEVGELIKVIYEHIYTLNLYLQREQWFTGDISHELRTPMMVISSSLDLLKQPATTAEQSKLLYSRIDAAVINVNDMINTFLLLARGKSSNVVAYEVDDLKSLVQDVIDNLELYYADKQINIQIKSRGVVAVSIDAALFSIVLTNLLKNAIVNIEQGDIIITLEDTGFILEDTGPGLPTMVKQFVNGDDITVVHENTNYLGLGLSIVKRVCDRENWQISAADREPRGTCFRLRF